MQTVSVTIDQFVEKKFENLLNEYGYEFSKHYDVQSEGTRAENGVVSFVLTSDEEFDLIELGMLNECARQIQQLENLDVERYKSLFDDAQSPFTSHERLLNPDRTQFNN